MTKAYWNAFDLTQGEFFDTGNAPAYMDTIARFGK